MAYYVTSTLKAQPSLTAWERMQLMLAEWMSEEIEELDRIIEYHHTNEQPKKAYRAKLRQQNYVATIEFITRLFQQQLSLHQQLNQERQAATAQLERARQKAIEYHGLWLAALSESELMNNIAVDALDRCRPVSQEEHNQRVLHQLKTDPLFRKGVGVLLANGINEL